MSVHCYAHMHCWSVGCLSADSALIKACRNTFPRVCLVSFGLSATVKVNILQIEGEYCDTSYAHRTLYIHFLYL